MADFVEGKVVCGSCAIHTGLALRGLMAGAYRVGDGEWRVGAMERPPEIGEFTNLDDGKAMIIGLEITFNPEGWPMYWAEVVPVTFGEGAP